MNLLNATKMQAGYTMGMNPDGRELLVVAIKGTFSIPDNEAPAQLAKEQAPLVEADVYTGEPGFSTPLYETDYAAHKPRCDVLFNGSAYAPGGKPAVRVPVTLQVGRMRKSFNVVGNRKWKKRLVGFKPSDPEPFTRLPFSYNQAFGGEDRTHKKQKKHKAYMLNPTGTGYHNNLKKEFVENTPMPITEELNNPVSIPDGEYQPMAYGPIGRGWQQRAIFAGTYDQDWIDNVFPFLPADFSEEYYQSAPPDQQIDYPEGGEQVVLRNLTPQGTTVFEIPQMDIPVVFLYKNFDEVDTEANIDTIVIEPDAGIFTLTWRSTVTLKKNMFEIVKIVAGTMPASYYRARRLGKTYYRSLKELVEAQNE